MDAPFPDGMLPDIEKFFREVHPTLNPGQDLYQEVFDTAHFFPLQRQAELRRMIQMTRSIEPRTVMEIGADKGGGLYHWCMCLPTVRNVIACEIRGTPYDALFERAFPGIGFYWGLDSQLQNDWYHFNSWLNGTKIDVLFIDGDKQGMYKDYELYRPMMRECGLVFVHDVRDFGPSTAWKRICSENPGKTALILDTSDYDAVKDRESRTPHEGWLKHWKGESCSIGVLRC